MKGEKNEKARGERMIHNQFTIFGLEGCFKIDYFARMVLSLLKDYKPLWMKVWRGRFILGIVDLYAYHHDPSYICPGDYFRIEPDELLLIDWAWEK